MQCGVLVCCSVQFWCAVWSFYVQCGVLMCTVESEVLASEFLLLLLILDGGENVAEGHSWNN